MNYVTLTQVRSYLGLNATETSDDTRLTTFIREASGWIDRHCGRRFDPRRETRLLDYPFKPHSGFGVYDLLSADGWVAQMNGVADLSAGLLRVDDDLLAVETLTNGDGAAIAASDYVLEPSNRTPSHAIRLLASSGLAWRVSTNGDREQCISVLGVWGYHDRYNTAWVDTLDTVRDNPLTIAATSLTVADADGVAADLDAPRFQAGQIIRVESEYLTVIAVNTTTNVLTVTRGANGTAAAQHAQGAAISVYRPMDNVQSAAMRLVVWKYRLKDESVFERFSVLGTTERVAPGAVPHDVYELLPAPKVSVR